MLSTTSIIGVRLADLHAVGLELGVSEKVLLRVAREAEVPLIKSSRTLPGRLSKPILSWKIGSVDMPSLIEAMQEDSRVKLKKRGSRTTTPAFTVPSQSGLTSWISMLAPERRRNLSVALADVSAASRIDWLLFCEGINPARWATSTVRRALLLFGIMSEIWPDQALGISKLCEVWEKEQTERT